MVLLKASESTSKDARREMALSSNPASSTPPPPGFPQMLTSSPIVNGHRDIKNLSSLRGEESISSPSLSGFKNGAFKSSLPSSEARPKSAQSTIWKDSRSMESNFYANSNGIMNTRTTSFTNLAAMVGTGLAESMEVSTMDKQDRTRLGADGLYDLSYARQFRHAASRMIGSSGSGLSPTANSLDLPNTTILPRRRAEMSMHQNLPGSALDKMHAGIFQEKDPLEGFKNSILRGQQPPIGISRDNEGNEVGVTVMEPSHSGSSTPTPPHYHGEVGSRQEISELRELHHDMRQMSISTVKSAQSSEKVSQNRYFERELDPFLWSVHFAEPSRALAIIGTNHLLASDIRASCEAFGVLEVFRAEFVDRGIVFVGYYDIRSAEHAATELKKVLERNISGEANIRVKYCVPMNSSSSQDESTLVISDLPRHIDELAVTDILAYYGAIRSLTLEKGAHYGGKSYVVEFYNVQEAKLALLELDSTHPLGPDVLVETASRRAVDRKRGRELLHVFSKWRQDRNFRQPTQAVVNNDLNSVLRSNSFESSSRTLPERKRNAVPLRADGIERPRIANQENHTIMRHEGDDNTNPSVPQQSTQLVLGPDGRYSYVVVNHAAFPLRHATHSATPFDPQTGVRVFPPSQASAPQQVFQGLHSPYMASVPQNPPQVGQTYWNQSNQLNQYHVGGTPILNNVSYAVEGAVYAQNNPNGSGQFYATAASNQTGDSSASNTSESNPNLNATRRVAQSEDKDNRHLKLDIDAVEGGGDTRTSLMVRNIPNKYTQQMLLSEFSDNGHGPGKIDFFYLPIDFKNKCNRGYAFVNFVNFRDIVPFHRQYFGQHWRVFNSDKICDITYARIQGKAGMLKRFENSALMEKDEEYKPLVFVSHGAEKGSRIAFPVSSTA